VDRREIINAFAEFRGDAVVVTGPGISSGMLWEAHAHPATVYNMELAYSGPIAMGIALGVPAHRVVSIDGDGSRFAAAASLGTMARYPLANLTLLTLANGIWGTGDGGTETTVGPEQWTNLAIACGWNAAHVVTAHDLSELREALRKSATEPGPWFICAVTSRSNDDAALMPDGSHRSRPRASVDIVQSADATRDYLSAKEKA
jgi:thiamine pyrophosphate-dependent acetolactate synthase large subunit-like protein